MRLAYEFFVYRLLLSSNSWTLPEFRSYFMAFMTSSVTRRAPTRGVSQCPTTIESTISGDFEGWSGETIFKLDNGQIWEQAEYSYTYSYAYRPDVTIVPTAAGCKMKVEDEDEMLIVRRIK